MIPVRKLPGGPRRDGILSVKTGSQVSVFARVSGSIATATSIFDSSTLSAGGLWQSVKAPHLPG